VPERRISVAADGEGELLVRGPMVMRGYYQNEPATRATLQDGWLRTGDIARIDAGGYVWITGRTKFVIVLPSGEKVYPDELEERFAESALVSDICVIGRPAGPKEVQICAVVCPSPSALKERAEGAGERPTSELVRRWVQEEVDRLQRGLPPYKRIGEVVLTDAPLPRTEIGKVRRGLVTDKAGFDLERLLQTAPVPA
jgi:long-chain acyl-CoA synthetase